MLKWWFHRKLRAFERAHDYDASFMHEVLDTDLGAFMKFGFATGLGSYRKDVPIAAQFAAGLTSSMRADCGPCTQLGVGFALQAGVASATVAAIIAGDDAAMPTEAALAARFAREIGSSRSTRSATPTSSGTCHERLAPRSYSASSGARRFHRAGSCRPCMTATMKTTSGQSR